jgi:large subunit ribosomal protein L22
MSVTSVTAKLSKLKSSPRKVGLVADLVRGMKARDAINQLTFLNKGTALPIKKLLLSCISNAENNHNLDPDTLFVDRFEVGKGSFLKRFCPRARGRASRITKYYSNIVLVLSKKSNNS